MIAPIRQLQQQRERAALAGHRHMAVLSGDRQWGREFCLQWLQESPAGAALLLSDRTLGGIEPTDARHVLGSESDLLIVDAWAGLNLDQLAAASGTLAAGGLMLLLTPDWQDWSERSDSPFLQRLCALLLEDETLTLINPHGIQQLPRQYTAPSGSQSLPTEDQDNAILAIVKAATGHRRRPLVIRADRGRGKSAALGLAVGQLFREHYGQVLVTAPRPSSVDVVFEHAQAALPGSERRGNTLEWGNNQLRFIPPDALLADKPEARLVLVDEAAAIPPAMLQQILAHYPRLVFATTVHGYEGSGRGFDVRFRDSLDTITPQWRSISLHQPIRWQSGDPLEDCLNRLLLLDAEPAEPETVEQGVGDFQIRAVSSQELVADDALLRQVFGLLVNAHYQTSPEDLRLLLDLPDARLFIAESRQQVLATILILEEGELPEALQDAIDNGERRLRGHLLPQTFAYHCAASQALSLRMARVVRIAVHASLRRRGLGSTLLRHVEQVLEADEFDLIGSSFAADRWVTAFWLQEEFSPMRLGTRRDSCSGSHALVVAKPLTTRGLELIEQLHQRFSKQFPVLLGEHFRQLEPSLALQLLEASLPEEGLLNHELDEVRRYATGVSTYDSTAAALWYYVRQQLPGRAVIPGKYRELLVMKVLQRRDWQELVALCGTRGRAETDDQLRLASRHLLAESQ